MSTKRNAKARRWSIAGTAVIALSGLIAACASAQPGGESTASARAGDAGASVSASAAGNPFAGLPYRINLPADWHTTATGDYDLAIEAGQEMQNWLASLSLMGPNSLRAYEPSHGGEGLRLAISPTQGDPLSPDLVSGIVMADDEPVGELVPIGASNKAFRTSWTQTLDWGDGVPMARRCLAYTVMYEAYEPVTVVFTYPADRVDRLSEVERMMSTFVVLGNPVVSLPPGTTPEPSPTPYDKFASQPPMLPSHSAPDLEALLPATVGNVPLAVESYRGDEAGYPPDDPILTRFDKTPADLSYAQATGSGANDILIIRVQRVVGVQAADLLSASFVDSPEVSISEVTVHGRAVMLLEGGWWPTYAYADGELLFQIAFTNAEVAAEALDLLP